MEITPQFLASTSERDAVRYMTERANKQMAHAVEKQLGDRYELVKDYDRAIRHIYYMERHMEAHCIPFTPFGIPQKFR